MGREGGEGEKVNRDERVEGAGKVEVTTVMEGSVWERVTIVMPEV